MQRSQARQHLKKRRSEIDYSVSFLVNLKGRKGGEQDKACAMHQRNVLGKKQTSNIIWNYPLL
jgi:hypothetical protein